MKEQETDYMRRLAFKYFEGNLLPEEEKELFGFLRKEEQNMQLFREWEEEWFVSNQNTSYIDNKWNRLSGRLHMQAFDMPKTKKIYSIGKDYFHMLQFFYWVCSVRLFFGVYMSYPGRMTLYLRNRSFLYQEVHSPEYYCRIVRLFG